VDIDKYIIINCSNFSRKEKKTLDPEFPLPYIKQDIGIL
jgi:hypothetical protein